MIRLSRGLRFITVLLSAAILVGGGFWGGRLTAPESPSPMGSGADDHPLLARRIFSRKPSDTLLNFVELRGNIAKYFSDNNLKGSAFFEYLPTGSVVDYKGDDKQFAASLLKLPLAMEYYKTVELGKVKPDQKITLKEEWLDDGYGTLYQKGAGYSLTLEETAKYMLVQSDNTALKAMADSIEQYVPPDDSVFKYLDVELQQNSDMSLSIGARAYSSILKCLYFSCYLNNDHSEHILKYLSETPYSDRLVAGIADKKITVAHKIGVYQNTTQSDCGIIYHPQRPYILCVMIDGQDTPTSDQHIADVSKIVYQYVTRQP